MRAFSALLALFLTVLAGCSSPPGEAVPATDRLEPDPVAQTAAFSLAGEISVGAFACAGMACHGHSEPDTSQQALPLDGTVTSINLTLEWTPSSDLMQELRLGLSWNVTGSHDFRFADGASPLRLEVPATIRADEEPYFWVNVPERAGLPVYISAPQSFEVHVEAQYP